VTPTFTVSPTITPTFTASPTPTATPIPLLLTPHSPNPDPAGPAGIWLPFTLSIPAVVQARIFNVSGELVRHLDGGGLPQGNLELHWDLRNDYAQAVSSGVYVCQIQADAQGQQSKVWEKCAVLR
jgi:hypothetical protein